MSLRISDGKGKRPKLKIPQKLVELSRLASDAMQGGFVLAELEGSRYFKQALAIRLNGQGWPIDPQKEHDSGMHEFIGNIFTDFSAQAPASYVEYNLRIWLEAPWCPAEVGKFVLDEKNLPSLDAAIKAAIKDTEQLYGDPLAVKFHQRNVLKAAFDAATAKGRVKSPETKLCDIFKGLIKTMKGYSVKDVPFIEFQGRVQEHLAQRDWKVSGEEKDSSLVTELWGLASAAQSKGTVMIRYELQDDTVPARKPYRAAKDFILENAADITAAAKTVAQELDRELVEPQGLRPRHFNGLNT